MVLASDQYDKTKAKNVVKQSMAPIRFIMVSMRHSTSIATLGKEWGKNRSENFCRGFCIRLWIICRSRRRQLGSAWRNLAPKMSRQVEQKPSNILDKNTAWASHSRLCFVYNRHYIVRGVYIIMVSCLASVSHGEMLPWEALHASYCSHTWLCEEESNPQSL